MATAAIALCGMSALNTSASSKKTIPNVDTDAIKLVGASLIFSFVPNWVISAGQSLINNIKAPWIQEPSEITSKFITYYSVDDYDLSVPDWERQSMYMRNQVMADYTMNSIYNTIDSYVDITYNYTNTMFATSIEVLNELDDIFIYAKKSKKSNKERATDIPSWAKGQKPLEGESGKDFARRLCDDKYGKGNYDMGPGSEYNKLRKYGDRSQN